MSLCYATTNFGKALSLQREFDKLGIGFYHAPIMLSESRSIYVDDVAREKIISAYKQIKKPVIVNDSGIYINSLNGFPGSFTNFALETIGLEGILKLVEGRDRSCKFRSCLAYLDDSIANPILFISQVEGIISDSIKGQMQNHLWSKLGLIFIPSGYSKTLGEFSSDEYVSWNDNRKTTSKNFAEWYVKRSKSK